MLQVIPSSQRAPFRPQFNKLLDKHFPDPGFPYNADYYKELRENQFFIANLTLADTQITSFASMVITTEKSGIELIDGKIQEHEVVPYPPGDNKDAWLFWMTLVVEDKRHTPYLIRNLLKETEVLCRNWKIKLTHVYAIAYTPVSERIMRKYRFERAGLYKGKYPIMVTQIARNPMLAAFIPPVDRSSHTPWG